MASAIALRVVIHDSDDSDDSDDSHTVTAEVFTDVRQGARPMLGVTAGRGFWCECWTEGFDGRLPPVLFGSFGAYSERAADSWVSTIPRTVSPALAQAKPRAMSVTHVNTRITWTIRLAIFVPLAHGQGVELPPEG